MAFQVKTYLQILQDMQTWIIANQDKVSDFNEGGVLASQLEAFAQELEEAYFLAKAGFTSFLIDLPFFAFNFTRKPGLQATGEVVFSRSTVATEEYTIPIGTVVSTDEGILFLTTEIGTISIGNTDSNTVTVQAQESGDEGNVRADTVVNVVTPVVGVETVNNDNALTGGQDQESDSEFLNRFQAYIVGLGKSSKSGLVTAALSVDGIRSASVEEHFPPDNQYNATLYIEDGSGSASAAKITEVEEVIEGDGTSENPGYRPVGVNVRVQAPIAVTTDVTVEITSNNLLSDATVEYNVNQAITAYVNGLSISEDVIYNRIIQRVMGVNGVTDVVVTVPASNVSVGTNQIARIGTITITFS